MLFSYPCFPKIKFIFHDIEGHIGLRLNFNDDHNVHYVKGPTIPSTTSTRVETLPGILSYPTKTASLMKNNHNNYSCLSKKDRSIEIEKSVKQTNRVKNVVKRESAEKFLNNCKEKPETLSMPKQDNKLLARRRNDKRSDKNNESEPHWQNRASSNSKTTGTEVAKSKGTGNLQVPT